MTTGVSRRLVALGRTSGTALFALFRPLRPGLGHFLAGDAAVAVDVEPLEHAVGALHLALFAQLPGLFGREAAVTICVEPDEALVGVLDDLLASHVGIAVGSRRIDLLGQRRAGGGDQCRAGDQDKFLHRIFPRSRLNVMNLPRPCRQTLSTKRKFVPVCRCAETSIKRVRPC
jgi:hypothetical protein